MNTRLNARTTEVSVGQLPPRNYSPTLDQVARALGDFVVYEEQRKAIEIELFGYADGEEWLFAA